MTTAPTGTVTFLFTDIEGSTRRWEAHPVAMRDAVDRHDALMRQAIAAEGGHVFKTIGDAFCAVFSTPHDAVNAALNAQLVLQSADASAIGSLDVRMSLHSGVADERDNDYFGPTVNRVARLLAAAHGQQVLLSGVTEALVSDNLSPGVSMIDLGSHRLKDLGRSEQIFQLAHEDLSASFPALRTLASYPNNLPQQLSSFVGREKELARVKELLGASRLLTLTGFGGSGKTRLGLQAALERLEQFPDGVWWVGLAPINDPGQVAGTVAAALGLREERGRRIEDSLVEHVRSRTLLLLLDNCEHLLDACRVLGTRLLQAAPGLHLLATSREALGIVGETAWSVPPLALPGGLDLRSGQGVDLIALAHSEAVRLFLDRAASVKPDFMLTEANAGAIVEICRRLDANPLAIELAATRVSAMSPQQIAERLKQRFRLLTGGSRTALPHQQTLRAALDWSHDLLDARERRLFRRLSIFAGGWTLEAAEMVCVDGDGEAGGEAPIEDWDVVDLASQLVSKSLVNVDDEASMRQWLQQTIREYAEEQLEIAGERELLAFRHARHFLALAERLESDLQGPAIGAAIVLLDKERTNLFSALSWAAERADPTLALRLGGSLWRFWLFSDQQHADSHEAMKVPYGIQAADGRESLERALVAARTARLEDSPELAKALHGAGTLATFQGDFTAAQSWLEAALNMWRSLGDETAASRTLNNLAILVHEHGDYVTARRLFKESLAAIRHSDDRASLARMHSNVATTALELGDLDEAQAGFEASLAIHRATANPLGIAEALSDLGSTALDRGDLGGARRLVEESLAISRELESKAGIASCLGHLSEIALQEGDLPTASSMAAQWLELEREMGNQRSIAVALGIQGAIAFEAGDDGAAQAALAESLQILDRIGHRRGQARSLNSLGQLALRQGNASAARARLGQALALRQAMGSPLHLLDSLETIVGLGVAIGQASVALQMAAAAAALRERLGIPLAEHRRAELQRILVQAEALTGGAAAASWERGTALTLDEAVALATALIGPQSDR